MTTKQIQFVAKVACRVFQDEDRGRQIWSLTLPVAELPKGLPYGPNARNADLGAKPAKAMLETLKFEPENFIYYNNGIMLVVKALAVKRVDGGDFLVRLEYFEPDSEEEDFLGHGVLNGGHTYKTIMHALYGEHKSGEAYPNAETACVQVVIAVGIEEDQVSSISRARNLSKAVPDYALKNLEGEWQIIEDHLPKQYRKNVIFKPDEFQDDADAFSGYTVVDLVQRLALFNNHLFDFRKDRHPIVAYTGKGTLVRNWKTSDYAEIMKLLPDILWFEEKVMEAHEKLNGKSVSGGKVVISKVSGCSNKPSRLITGRKYNLTVAQPFIMPVLAALRIVVKDGEWIQDKEDIWEEYGLMLVDRLWESYKTEGRSSAAMFGRSKSTWSTLTNAIAMQFIKI